jgi:hypothetical protein
VTSKRGCPRAAASPVLLEVDTDSYWAPFLTYFPALGTYLDARHESACVLGASDGKFVVPLLRAGFQVTAVDTDEVFLFGGSAGLTRSGLTLKGLVTRLAEEDVTDRCAVVVRNYMEWKPPQTFDIVVTSGLWSMPQNHRYSLAELVGRAQDLTASGGILFADYLAELPEEQVGEHYPALTQVSHLFGTGGWELLESVDLGIHGESHYDKPEWHYHRFAALIARKVR